MYGEKRENERKTVTGRVVITPSMRLYQLFMASPTKFLIWKLSYPGQEEGKPDAVRVVTVHKETNKTFQDNLRT